MKKRPILFSGEMVRAILEGRKTQTRRVITPQPDDHPSDEGFGAMHRCRWQVGDRLWVKETWGAFETLWTDCGWEAQGLIDFTIADVQSSMGSGRSSKRNLIFKADGYERVEGEGKWKPSIHMPRWASRITLEITQVRVQRLQDISASNALSEGITCPRCGYSAIDAEKHLDHQLCTKEWLLKSKVKDCGDHPAIQAFRDLWESINGEGSWSSNPFVWVIDFKVVKDV